MTQDALAGDTVNVRPRTLAQQNADFTVEGASAAGMALPRPDGAVAMADWDSMLSAVTARLRQAASEAHTHGSNGAAAPLQVVALECADALDQVQALLGQAVAQRERIALPDGATTTQG